jgi:hypothetical protein
LDDPLADGSVDDPVPVVVGPDGPVVVGRDRLPVGGEVDVVAPAGSPATVVDGVAIAGVMGAPVVPLAESEVATRSFPRVAR